MKNNDIFTIIRIRWIQYMFFLSLQLIAQEATQIQPKILKTNILYTSVSETAEFPPPYQIIDSLLFQFQDWLFSTPNFFLVPKPKEHIYWDDLDLPLDLLTDFAKVLLWKDYYPYSNYRNYLKVANAPAKEQAKRISKTWKRDEVVNEKHLPMPGFVLNPYIIQKQIKKRFPFDWYFLLENRYMFIVEPFTKDLEYIDPESRLGGRAYYYQCKFIEDVKGNYFGEDTLLLATNFLKGPFTEMEIGKKYLVLISLDANESSHRGLRYLVRGLVTNGRGIFPIDGDKIIDFERELDKNTVFISNESITGFKKSIEFFINQEAGISNEN